MSRCQYYVVFAIIDVKFIYLFYHNRSFND